MARGTCLGLLAAFALTLVACDAAVEGATPPEAGADTAQAPAAAPEDTPPAKKEKGEEPKADKPAPEKAPEKPAEEKSTAKAEEPVKNPAPAFTLPDTHGKKHSLADYKGKWVVLEWINHGCPFVKKHYKEGHMQALQKKYKEKGVVWLSICSSADGKQGHMTAERWNKVLEKKGAAPTAVLLDPAGNVGHAYKAKTTPHMYIINPKGGLVYQGAIDSKKSADPADIAKSDNYVTQVLDAVLAGKEPPVTKTRAYGCSVKYAAKN